MKRDILSEALEIKEELILWRRSLHRIPEVGLILPETFRFVTEQLDRMGITYKTYTGHSGIVADFGNGQGKTVAIRGDMDGLPIEEDTGLEFSSENKNMHACGHDAHTAILLAAAKLLKRHESEINGTVRLLFQPGEEWPGGAEPMVKDGVMENPKVDYMLALHTTRKTEEPYQNGAVIISNKYVSASDEQIYVTVKGRGGHGCAPDECIDPIAAAVLIINNLQYIVSREVSPLNSSVITIATVRAGNGTSNIIPDEAEFIGTVRNVDMESRNFVMKRIEEIIDHTAKAMRADYTFRIDQPYPPLLNDATVSEHVRKAAKKIAGEERVRSINKPEMGGEDCAFFFQKAPGCYFYLQTAMANPRDGEYYPAHNARYCVDDSVLYIGAGTFVEAAMSLLEE